MLRLYTFITLLAVSTGGAQLLFETKFRELEVHPLELEKEMSFPFKVGENPVEIKELDVSCSCLNAELSDNGKLKWLPGESGSIRLKYDLSRQGGKVKKAVRIHLKDGTVEKLVGSITIPEYIKVTPKTHRWKLSAPSVEKVYTIQFKEDFKANIIKIIPTKDDFNFRLETVQEGKEYHFFVTPKQTETPSFCLFKIYTDSEIPRFEKVMLFSVVDDRGPLKK